MRVHDGARVTVNTPVNFSPCPAVALPNLRYSIMIQNLTEKPLQILGATDLPALALLSANDIKVLYRQLCRQ